MHFDTAILCESGGRGYNEDCCGHQQHDGNSAWVLADGLGGHGSGDIAAQTAVDAVLAHFRTRPEVSIENLLACLVSGHEAVLGKQNGSAATRQMYTTAVVLLASQHTACWGHAGDSRLYFFHGGRIAKRTLDHSVPQTLVSAGQLREREIRFHEDRNRLLRTLGSRQELKPSVDSHGALESGDAFLLVSDGFWEYVFETEMEVELARAASAASWIDGMKLRLRTRAMSDRDNCSAIAVFVE
ncbi:MAG: serine/threonine-protein phosphatase [Bryobacterales bacterium]|nr:serine/threonine-protein phosphatase [Bryobacterales bacterium]